MTDDPIFWVGVSASVKREEASLPAEVPDKEQLQWKKDKSQLQEQLQALKGELIRQTKRLEELLRACAKKQDPSYCLELEMLAESQGVAIDQLRRRQTTLEEDMTSLKEENARISGENERMKDARNRVEQALQITNMDHEKIVKQMSVFHENVMKSRQNQAQLEMQQGMRLSKEKFEQIKVK